MTNKTTASQPNNSDTEMSQLTKAWMAAPDGPEKIAAFASMSAMAGIRAASQPKSIGDDAQFRSLMVSISQAMTSTRYQRFHEGLVKLIDSHAPPAPASATIQAAHPDDIAVQAFADAMKAKMAKSRAKGRGGWQECHAEDLRRMLVDHMAKGDPVDVGNFAMMLWNRDESTAAPMVADPAGVVLTDAQIAEIYEQATSYPLSDDDHHGAIAFARGILAATVMAVPSEALEGACTVCKGKGCDHCDGMGLEPRKVVGYSECRCILKQYCDGQCRPIFADQQPVILAAPLADNTGGGE